MHKAKRRRCGIPPRWLNCPRIGHNVNYMFVPFKTPIDEKYDSEIQSMNRFSLSTFLSHPKSKNIGLIIDLTKTSRYYKAEQLEGIKCYSKIPCEGHEGAPTVDQVTSFIELAFNFFEHNPETLIGVHCTHGFNRTGFMIISYLCERCDMELDTAVHVFANARPPGIYKQDYLDELAKRFVFDGVLNAPSKPDWCSDDDDEDEDEANIPEPTETLSDSQDSSDDEIIDSEKSSNGFKSREAKKKRKPQRQLVLAKNPTFMEGVRGVSTVTDFSIIETVHDKIRELMGSTRFGFIGSQPVTMTKENLHLIEEKSYLVSWKADGTRYLMLILDQDLVYMLDRDNAVYKVEKINFPKNNMEHLADTLVDGEMVIDVFNNEKFPRYLIYDIMNLSGEYVGDRPFINRLELVKSIIKARTQNVKLEQKQRESFGVRIKDFWPIEKTKEIWEGKFRQQLCHEMDGLIFQPNGKQDFYESGRCNSILKWKPPEMNSIDFLLKTDYVKAQDCLPQYIGYLFVSGLKQHFGTIDNIKKEWRQKYDGKIVECNLIKPSMQWDIMRERTDKSVPNHYSTAESVLQSIKHPVSINDVYQTIYHMLSNRR